ncbi:hypothetical protein JFK97_20395 [Chromobacterium phragmitis]|uniref:transcriptional regulator KorA n=1 Tax=Chromobacterium amazonense TaxID=1382803 RepID=UPI0021B7C65E|nr:transcriptional regulator KorA [Chromobacterium amazonense]MBM2886754.1 hypothetical protein [Chromobacterium amazonense]
MKPKEFDALVTAHKLKGGSVAAARLVLVDGMSAYAAAQKTGLAESTISRALDKLARPLCQCCGQPLPEKKD